MEPTEMNNQEEQYGQQPEVQAEPVASTESVAEPEDLAAAFSALRAQNTPSADKPVEASESAPEPEPVQSPVEQPSYDYDRNTAGYVQGTDWTARDKETVAGVRAAVVAAVGREWQEQGRRAIKMDDLVRRDERTGELYYINLDDDPQKWNQPGYRGTDKATARRALKDFNEDLQEKWNEDCRAKEKEMMQAIEPHRKLLAFGPTYEKLDQETREVLDNLADDFVLRLPDGTPYGFNADLNLLLRQAERIVNSNRARYGTVKQQQQQTAPVRQPVVDSRSSAGGSKQNTPQAEPKDIGDAIAMFERMQREQRKAR